MFEEVFSALSVGFLKTLEIFAFTLVGAVPLGLVICAGSMSSFKPLSKLVRAIVTVVRGTPLMLQLLVIFYGPGLIFGNNLWGGDDAGRMAANIVAFVFNYACYFSEIYRGGIESIDPGQYEAASVLGLGKRRTFFYVILPQVFKRILPSMGNEVITLVKDTSLARVISVYEIMYVGQSFIKSRGIIWPLFFTGVFYLAFSAIVAAVLRKIEKSLYYFH